MTDFDASPIFDIDGNALSVGDRVQNLRREIVDPLNETLGLTADLTRAESHIRPTPIESANAFMNVVDLFDGVVTVENQWQSFTLSGLDVRLVPTAIDWSEAEQDYYRSA